VGAWIVSFLTPVAVFISSLGDAISTIFS